MQAPEARTLTTALAYVRCSSERQAKQESSLPAQKAEIERRASQDGATVIRWFEDDGISGKNIEDRPGLNACLDYVAKHKGEIARLYVYDTKRMARNKADAFAIRRELHRAKVQLIAIAQPSVEDEAANAILESVYDGIAEAERINLAKVVRRGQKQALTDGWWPYPRPPYGFRSIGMENSRGARRFKLLPDPETSEVVKQVFALYLGGSGAKNIASTLDRAGIKPPSRGDLPKGPVQGWRAKHVKHIIENPACWGATTWDEQIVNENHHPAIVDRATWETAQGLAKSRARAPSELSSINTTKSEHGLFRPWLRCGCCGGTMSLNRGGTATNRVWYYACSSRLQNNAACKGLTCKADDLDAALLDVIEHDVLTPERIDGMIRDTLARMKLDAGGELRARRATLEGLILTCNVEMQKITKMVATGMMEMEDGRPLTAPIMKARADYRAELAALPEPQPVPTVDEVNPEAFRKAITDRWRAKDVTVQRKALDRIVNEIRLEPGKALVRYSWKVEPEGYTYQMPSGPSYGTRQVYELLLLFPGVQHPKFRKAA